MVGWGLDRGGQKFEDSSQILDAGWLMLGTVGPGMQYGNMICFIVDFILAKAK